jgi:hydroxypyruvate isomerase
MPRFAANLSMMFDEVPFLDRFAAAARAGFEAVEFLFPYDQDPAAIRAALDANRLTLALHNTPPGDWAAGERGYAAVPGAEARFEAEFARALAYARVLRPGRIHVLAGTAQGPAARAAYVANLRRAAAAAPDLVLTIEPLNPRDMPGYHLARSDDALAVIEAVGAPNLRLQFDLYHAQIAEGDLTRRIEALAPVLGHVQVAGVPDRHEPDRGELNFAHLMAVLDSVGYDGWVGCEYRPADGTEAGLGWFAPWRRAAPHGESP